jgi:hypothetical protein
MLFDLRDTFHLISHDFNKYLSTDLYASQLNVLLQHWIGLVDIYRKFVHF